MINADIIRPLVESIDINLIWSNEESGERRLEVSGHFKDNLSGIAIGHGSLVIEWRSPSGVGYGTHLHQLDSGNNLDGIYKGIISLPRNAESGTWTLQRLEFRDNVGNSVGHNRQSLLDLGIETDFILRKEKGTTIRGNFLYTIVEGPSWTQAEANAVKMGGHLTAIGSEQENKFLHEEFGITGNWSDPNSSCYLIGLTDLANEGVWKWSNGEQIGYINWIPDGITPNGGREENYVHLGRVPGGYWNDDLDIDPRNLGGISETPFIRRGDSAYVIVQGPTWEEAEANAVKLGGHLVTINDAAENEWLHIFANIDTNPNLDSQNTSFFWTGLNDAQTEGTWMWSSGEPVLYINWANKEPSNGANSLQGEDYVHLGWAPNKQWNDFPSQGIVSAYTNHLSRHRGIAEIKLAPNNTPTGTPSITGTAMVGSSLTINASSIKDADNFTGYTPAYNYSFEVSSDNGVTWTKLTSTDATDNNNNYTLTTAEVGKQVRGVVSYLDGFGTNESVTSLGSSVTSQVVVRGNSLYTIVPGPSWTQAEANAVKLGGDLVVINDKEENNFLLNTFDLLSGEADLWIGLSDQQEEGSWIAADGTKQQYFNWLGGIPDNDYYSVSDEDYVCIVLDPVNGHSDSDVGTWNDLPNTLANLPGSGWASGRSGIAEIPFIRRGDSAYVIVQGPTWEEAEANAVKLGGHLVSINDAAENQWLYGQITNRRGSEWGLWIGATDKISEGILTDSEGNKLGFNNFYPGEPNNLSNYDSKGEDYAAITTELGANGGKWADIANAHPTPNSIISGIAEIKLAPNCVPTGSPSITGTLKAGSTLTVDGSTVQDADNFTGYTPTYQYNWEVSSDNGTTWSKLTSIDASDNNSTYTLTTAEVGKQVRGVVSYLDGYGTNEAVNSVSSVVLPNNPPTQEVFTNKTQIAYTPSKIVTVPLQYKTSAGDSQLSGLTLNVHYNSSILTPITTNNGVSDQLPVSITTNKIVPDTNNLDNDPLTDKTIQLVWATFDNTFPNKTLPTTLANLTFNTSSATKDPLTGAPLTTTLRYTASETASGYDFLTNSTILKASTFNLDVDGDGQVKALTDGLMIIRKLLGPAFDGEALTFKAIGSGATRSTEEIHTYIQGAIDSGMLDVDKNNKTTALTDGLMVIRRLLGPAFDGDALTFKALASDSPYFGKTDAPALVSANIDSLRPF